MTGGDHDHPFAIPDKTISAEKNLRSILVPLLVARLLRCTRAELRFRAPLSTTGLAVLGLRPAIHTTIGNRTVLVILSPDLVLCLVQMSLCIKMTAGTHQLRMTQFHHLVSLEETTTLLSQHELRLVGQARSEALSQSWLHLQVQSRPPHHLAQEGQ